MYASVYIYVHHVHVSDRGVARTQSVGGVDLNDPTAFGCGPGGEAAVVVVVVIADEFPKA